jgi:hypothetical protein
MNDDFSVIADTSTIRMDSEKLRYHVVEYNPDPHSCFIDSSIGQDNCGIDQIEMLASARERRQTKDEAG